MEGGEHLLLSDVWAMKLKIEDDDLEAICDEKCDSCYYFLRFAGGKECYKDECSFVVGYRREVRMRQELREQYVALRNEYVELLDRKHKCIERLEELEHKIDRYRRVFCVIKEGIIETIDRRETE